MAKRTILILSLVLSLLIIIESYVGLVSPNFYALETPNWQAQSIGQDFINLFIISPSLILSSILMFKGFNIASNVWSGILFYLTYTFVLYAFDVHFNNLFLFYCFSLGLSFYLLLYYFFSNQKTIIIRSSQNNSGIRLIAIYFISISVLFYLLWVSEIVPSILSNTRPKSVIETGLFTNGVHVLDLSIVLPGIFITGILLLKDHHWGYIMTPTILTFFIFMNITIASLIFRMIKNKLEGNSVVASSMIFLTIVSICFMILFYRKIRFSSNV